MPNAKEATAKTGKKAKKAAKKGATVKTSPVEVKPPVVNPLKAKGTYVLEPNEEFRVVVGTSSIVMKVGPPPGPTGPGPGGSSSKSPSGSPK